MTERAAELARTGFTDGRRAAGLLQDVLGRVPAQVDADALVRDLAATADPDQALLSLTRVLEADPGLGDLLAEPGTARDRVLTVLGASAALGDHLVHHPEHVPEVADPTVYGSSYLPSREGATSRLCAAVAGLTGRDGLDALRVAYRRELVLVATADLTAPDPSDALPWVAAALADLASAALEAALLLARAETEDEGRCRFAVVGMGKAGGRELNYISDVDVVFLAEPAGGATDEEAMRVGTRLATAVMRTCAHGTGEGALWQVDVNLRPEGRNGPLVRTLASHREYYQRWARTWEFQALLKARHVAGDAELSQQWLDVVEPLVWQASSRPGFVDEVQQMRRRVEQHVPRAEADRQLKLGAGGLRDIEFSVQLLQLVHGRADETLRSGTTLEALDALSAGGYVGREDASALDAAYRFLRVLEHRVQLHRLRRTHLMPTAEVDLRRMGRSLGLRSDPEGTVVAQWRSQQREVRRLHERLFYRPLLAAVARLSPDEVRLSPEAARERLAALGFRDPAGAMRHLEAMTSGVSRRTTIQRHLLPVMLGWLAGGADPDAGLLAFRRISETLGSTHWYLRMLRDEGSAAQRLAHVLSSSRYAVELLIRSPESVALLGEAGGLRALGRDDLQSRMVAAAGRQGEAVPAIHAARAVRVRELVRIVLADLLGELDEDGVRAALSDLTDALVSTALEVATREVCGDEPPVRLLVVGMGRLGGRELGYGSDADVLYVHDPAPGADPQEAGARAEAVVALLRKGLSGAGPDPPLELDADLRPEGRTGPLVRSLESYAAYYRRWSAGWESQALLRARAVAGDPALAQRFEELVAPLRWPEGGLDASAVRHIRRLKARMEGERLPRNADPRAHLKLGMGGLTDVEWVAQLLQLEHAHEVPGLRTPSTLEALTAAREAGLLESADERVLREAWCLASRLRDAGVLWRGRSIDSVPSDLRDAEGMSRILGHEPGHGAELAEQWRRSGRRARQAVERLFYGHAAGVAQPAGRVRRS